METEKLLQWLNRFEEGEAPSIDEEMEFMLYEMRVTDMPVLHLPA